MYGNPELETVSEVHFRRLLGTTIDPNISLAMEEEDHFCKLILYKEIAESRVRIWDVVILIPNLIFLIFIIARFNRARLKLRATSSPIYLAFYGLVVSNIMISVIRCVVSMSVNAAATVGGFADKILWVTVRFFLLSTEMSVVIFGLAFGHLDSRASIRRVLFATSLIALAFTITQGTLELVLPDDTFEIPSRKFFLFGHGGMMFWFCSSLVFTMIYLFILILPWTRLRERLALPTRKSFYVYIAILALLDMVQSIGAGLLNYTQASAGLCIVDLTAAMYLTLFTPLVYHTFLSEVFGVSQPSISFSYKAQVDDAMDEDTVSLPHQQSFSSLKTDSDYIYQVHTPSIHMPLYDPTPFKHPSTSKQRGSLYSLTSEHALEKNWSRRTMSQVSLSSISKVASQSTLKSTSHLDKNSSSKLQKFEYSPISTPNLNIDSPIWDFSSAKPFQGGANRSYSALPQTASKYIYEPQNSGSNVNLFSPVTSNSVIDFEGTLASKRLSSPSILLATDDACQTFQIRDTNVPTDSKLIKPESTFGQESSEIVDNSKRRKFETIVRFPSGNSTHVRMKHVDSLPSTSGIQNIKETKLQSGYDMQSSDLFALPSTSGNQQFLPSQTQKSRSTNSKISETSSLLTTSKDLRSSYDKNQDDSDDNIITFSPTRQSTFKDQSETSRYFDLMYSDNSVNSLNADFDETIDPLNRTVSQNFQSTTTSRTLSSIPSETTFYSANSTLYDSEDANTACPSPTASSNSSTFHSLSQSNIDFQEAAALRDYLKLLNTSLNNTK